MALCLVIMVSLSRIKALLACLLQYTGFQRCYDVMFVTDLGFVFLTVVLRQIAQHVHIVMLVGHFYDEIYITAMSYHNREPSQAKSNTSFTR